jgi:O-antigen/teichoic acid export membrane protein
MFYVFNIFFAVNKFNLDSSKPKNNYINNSLWSLLEKVSRIISGLLVGVLVARYLGPSQFGTISYALNIVAIFTIFSTLGLDSIVVRELILRKERTAEILGTAFWLRFIGAILVVIISTFYSYLRDPAERVFIVFLISISIVFQSYTVIDFYFQSIVKGKLTAINQVITLFISALVKIYFIVFNYELIWFAGMAAFEACLTMINQFVFYKYEGQFISRWFFSVKEAKVLFKYTWPIIISSFIQMIYQKADQILILRFLRDIDLVGQYAAAIRMSEASYFIPVAITAAVFPGIINNRENRKLQVKRFTQLCSLLIWSAIFISLGVQVFGDWVIQFFYKEKYPLSADVFKIHIWATIPTFYGTALGLWFLAENKQRVIILYQVVNIFAYTVMSFILIPRFGIYGAAYAIVITYYLGLIVTTATYKPRESLKIMFDAFNPMNLLDIVKYWKESKIKK